MERADKHGPRLDDELAAQTEALGRRAPIEPRVEDEREERDRGTRTATGTSAPRENDAPDPAVRALERLPGGVEFATAHEVWAALQDPSLAEDPEALRELAATGPPSDADR